MRKLVVFSSISVDGYSAGEGGDISWAHSGDDAEFRAFVEGNASGGGMLVFGRKTYEMMAGYWPTPLAATHDPVVAERMNSLPKLVFSRTLAADWRNTTLVRDDPVATIRRLKQEPGAGMCILGSASLVLPLAEAGLVDEFQLVVVPVALGTGSTLFAGLRKRLPLVLRQTRAFGNGNVLLCYGVA